MSLAMNSRRDYRGNRAALFDDVEEGGIRAGASYSSHEIDEHENDRAIEGLSDRVLMLKRLTGDIHEEVDSHNRMLDRMGNDMDSSRGILSGTMEKFKMETMTVVSKTEVNLHRLLAAAPHQENQAKLVHYVATLRELLEQLTEEKTPEGLPRISKAKVNEYSEKIQAVATKLATPVSDTEIDQEPIIETSTRESSPKSDGKHILDSQGLRRRSSSVKERSHDNVVTDQSGPVKLDTAAQTHIAKHRKLQEDLTDEMVVLARQLKESSQMMSQSLKNTEKILDSTEKAVEHSLASTGHANTRAMEVYSHSFKTTCFTWLAIFAMTCIFIMVVLLIRVT